MTKLKNITGKSVNVGIEAIKPDGIYETKSKSLANILVKKGLFKRMQ